MDLYIPRQEAYDSSKNQFIDYPGRTLRVEHSLISISKWESFYKKPFLSDEQKTNEELDYYILNCMCIDRIEKNSLIFLTQENRDTVLSYIADSMTATTFWSYKKNQEKKERITSELIYFWMIRYNIPMAAEKWHLNRLLTLIKVCNIKDPNSKGNKKMSQEEIMEHQRRLNEERRKKYGV